MPGSRKSSRRPSRDSKRQPIQREWQLQEAKARFSELFRLARESGPQRVTKHGRTAVVVLPVEQYERLMKGAANKESLVRFFANSPLVGSGVQFERQRDYGRTVEL